MVNPSLRRSPFESHTPGSRPTRAGGLGVHISAHMLTSVTLVSTWHSGIDALSQTLGAALGTSVPEQTGHTVQATAGLVLRSGPEEFMVISDQTADMTTWLRHSVTADMGSVTNLSHARCRIHIEGEKCLDTLSKLFALDFRDAAFPLGQIQLSGHHHVPCMLHRLGQSDFDLYVFSTYAHDQLATLLDAALEYGVTLTN